MNNLEALLEIRKIVDAAIRDTDRGTDESGVCLAEMPGDHWYCTKPKGHAGKHSCHMLDFMP